MFGIDNPDTLLRPWANLKQFSEELYAAFVRGKAQSIVQPQEEEVKTAPPGTVPHRRVSDYSSPQPSLRARPTPPPNFAQQQAAAAPVTLPERTLPVPPPPPARQQQQAPQQQPQQQEQPQQATPPPPPPPEPSRRQEPPPTPRRPDQKVPTWPPGPSAMPQGAYPLAGGGGGTYMGSVIDFQGGSGSADSSSSVTVQLYSAGPNGAPDDTGPNGEPGGQITVGLLYFLGSDFIPPGYWMAGIIPSSDGTTYWAQVPVWN